MFQRPSATCSIRKMESPPKMSHDSFAFRFPARLWRIINSCTTGAISWGPNGKTIRILRKKFEEQYLTGNAKPFKTTKYESFVRQLNHYGFKKVKKRSAVKRITTPIMHGETKEEAAMLSEYHNPNFTRGNPERVTFLERRCQMPDDSGNKKRSKKVARAHVEPPSQENGTEPTPAKKTKKETSAPVLRTLLCPETDGLNTSAEDNSETQSEYSKSETDGNTQEQMISSRVEYDVMTRHSAQSSGQPFTLKPLPPIYAPHTAGSGRMDGSNATTRRFLPHHRPYYSPDRFDSSYSEPYPPQRYSYLLSPPWQRGSAASSRTQLYDDYVTAQMGTARDRFYRAYASDPRAMFMPRSASGRGYSMYPDDNFSPRDLHGSWNSMYGINRRGMVALNEAYNDGYDPDQFIPVGLRFSEVSRYRRPSPEARYYPGDESYIPLPRHQYDGFVPRASMQSQMRIPFLPPGGHPIYPCNNDLPLQDEVEEYVASHRYHGDYVPSPARENSAIAYGETTPCPEVTGLWKVDVNRSKGTFIHATVHELSGENNDKYIVRIPDDGSNPDTHGESQQQPGNRWTSASTKKQAEIPQTSIHSESLNMITEDTSDLPLDVAEETVVTSDTASVDAPDYSSSLMPYYSVEGTTIIDSLVATNAPLPADDRTKLYTEGMASEMGTYSSCNSSALVSTSSSSQCKLTNDYSTTNSEECASSYTPVSMWNCLEKDLLKEGSTDARNVHNATSCWTFPASRLLEETAKKASTSITKDVTDQEDVKAEKIYNSFETENNIKYDNLKSDQADSSKSGKSQSEPTSRISDGDEKGEPKGTLTQLSNSGVQGLLSAAAARTVDKQVEEAGLQGSFQENGSGQPYGCKTQHT